MPNSTSTIRTKIIGLAFALLFAAACSKPQEEETEAVVPVETAAVRRATIQRLVQAPAILHPCNQAGITPKISAPVRTFHVNRGDPVRKGQLLAELENQDLVAAAIEAKGNYEQAQANYRSLSAASLPEELARAQGEVRSNKEVLDAAQKIYESRKSIFEQGALPRKQLDESNLAVVQARSQYEIAVRHLEGLQRVGKDEQLKSAQAQVDAAKGRQQGAEAQLEYSRIISPMDGVIADRPLYAGEMANSGAPLLTVMDVSRVIARAIIPGKQLSFLKVGNPAKITTADPPEEFSGKVTMVSPALDPNSTTAEVWVLLSNPGENLKPGASVQVSIQAETFPDTLAIPVSALLPSEEGTGNAVFVIGSDLLAQERKIELGVREEELVQVLKGLATGEQVVTVGGLGLQDKTKVKVVNQSSGKNEQNDESKPEK
jgi:HlyD family secretion protein